MQFSSDLDENTQKTLEYGRSLMALLRQPQYSPLAEYKQIILLVAATGHAFAGVRAEDIPALKGELLSYFDAACGDIISEINTGAALTAELKTRIIEAAKSFVATYQAANH